MNLEIETKLSAPDDLVLPMLDLTAAGLRTAEKPTKLTVTTYFDTESFDLFSCGAALRFRRSSQASRDEAGIWTLKFAPPAKGYVSSRFEFELEASGVQVPLKFIPALAVFGAAEPFNKLASLAAARRAIIFETEAGLPVIELDDDFVEIVEGPNQGLRFREIEVEQMVQGFAKQAEEIALHVLSAGASYAKSSSKLEQALENAKNQGFFSKLLDRYPHLVISDLSVLAGLVLEDPADLGSQMEQLSKAVIVGLQEDSAWRLITELVSWIAENGPLSGGFGSALKQFIAELSISLSRELRESPDGHLERHSSPNPEVGRVAEFISGKASSILRETDSDWSIFADLLVELATLPPTSFQMEEDRVESFIRKWS